MYASSSDSALSSSRRNTDPGKTVLQREKPTPYGTLLATSRRSTKIRRSARGHGNVRCYREPATIVLGRTFSEEVSTSWLTKLSPTRVLQYKGTQGSMDRLSRREVLAIRPGKVFRMLPLGRQGKSAFISTQNNWFYVSLGTRTPICSI